MPQQAKRGFLPSDETDFGADALPVLRKAAGEVCYLLDRGYPVAAVIQFVGNHYQFTERQRLALARTLSPCAGIQSRKSREVMEISGETIYIDGFNVIIGLEIVFSDSMLFRCMDGTVRDLAGLHGTYRPIPQTDQAIRAMLAALESLNAAKAVIYLDKPVSNSGRLRQRILEAAADFTIPVEVLIENPVDALLKTKPLVASADAIILDQCGKWFNLVRYIVDTQFPGYPYVEISPEP